MRTTKGVGTPAYYYLRNAGLMNTDADPLCDIVLPDSQTYHEPREKIYGYEELYCSGKCGILKEKIDFRGIAYRYVEDSLVGVFSKNDTPRKCPICDSKKISTKRISENDYFYRKFQLAKIHRGTSPG